MSFLLYINIRDTVEMAMILSKNYNNLQEIVSFAVMYDEEHIWTEIWIEVTCWEGGGMYI